MADARDPKAPEQIVDLLRTPGGGQAACDAVTALAGEAKVREIAALARTLEASADRKNPTSVEDHELVIDHIEDQLAASPTEAAVDALFALSLEPRERSVAVPRSRELRLRAFGSRLGYGQTPEGFLSALARHGENAEHRELLACWMHEVILRGTSLGSEPRARELADRLASAGHPLAKLPLELLPAEREVPSYMPLYGNSGLGGAIEALTSGAISLRSIPPPGDSGPVETSTVIDEAAARRLVTAVAPWVEGKNGKAETKLFAFSRKLESSGLGRTFLRSLPLESVAEATHLDVQRTAAEGVFGPLFSAASNGGAYSSGLGGAYGRLAAWVSLGALVGAAEGVDPKAVDALASKSAFLVYRAEGPWFYDVAWDLGVLALRSDGRSAAALAATDVE